MGVYCRSVPDGSDFRILFQDFGEILKGFICVSVPYSVFDAVVYVPDHDDLAHFVQSAFHRVSDI